MSRPDSRLLVPVSALPFVPEGARVWGGVAGSAWIAIGEQRADRMLLCDTEPDGSSRDVRRFDRSPTMLLDASAPELRDGLPVRLDALPWLLAAHQKAHKYGGTLVARFVGCRHFADTPFPRIEITDGDGYVLVTLAAPGSDSHGSARAYMTVDPWLDLTGLTPDEAARAVVVAAVLARGSA